VRCFHFAFWESFGSKGSELFFLVSFDCGFRPYWAEHGRGELCHILIVLARDIYEHHLMTCVT
jgi:hypothetical protein